MRLGPALVFALLTLAAGARTAAAAAPVEGAAAPDFVLKSVAGDNIRLSEYRGEVVMLAFWASWCGDCRAALEGLAETRLRYGDAGVQLLAVSLDQDRRSAEQAAAAMAAEFPILHDAAGEIGRLYDVDTMPMMVLVDRDGVVRKVFAGHRRGEEPPYLDEVRAVLREY